MNRCKLYALLLFFDDRFEFEKFCVFMKVSGYFDIMCFIQVFEGYDFGVLEVKEVDNFKVGIIRIG